MDLGRFEAIEARLAAIESDLCFLASQDTLEAENKAFHLVFEKDNLLDELKRHDRMNELITKRDAIIDRITKRHQSDDYYADDCPPT
jgi:hypothetical protein